MTNSTDYTKQSVNPTSYTGVGSETDYFLLLQTGDFLLFQDDSSKLILESGPNSRVGYTAGTTKSTGFTKGTTTSTQYTKQSTNSTDYT